MKRVAKGRSASGPGSGVPEGPIPDGHPAEPAAAVASSCPVGDALAASELRYRRLFETAKDGILILNAETGRVVDVNPFLMELLGFSREAFIGKKVWELGFFKDIVANQDHFAELQQQKYIRYDDKPLETADGRRVDVEFVSNVYLVNRQDVIQCNIRDITERKRATKTLLESAQRIQLLLDSITESLYGVDTQGNCTFVNRACLQMLGYDKDEDLLGRHIHEMIHHTRPDGTPYPAEECPMYGAMRRGADPHVHVDNEVFWRRDGTSFPVEYWSHPIFCEGRVTGAVATFFDITERRRTEESVTRLAMAVEQVAETIMITDANAMILYTNPAFEKTSGYTRDEAVGQTPEFLRSNQQDAEFYQRMWAVLRRGEVWRGHLISKRKDGTVYEEDASISPVRDAAGKIVNYVAAKRDVTHEVQLEGQLRQAQKMDAVGRLAGGVAHDFNNLLQIILGITELLLADAAPDDPRNADLKEIMTAARRSADLTRQLLAFARKQIIAPKILDVNEAVTGMLKLLRRLIGEDIILAWLPGANLWTVRLDPSQLDQILANLCINARDAIAGVGKITLETGNLTVTADYCATHADAIPGQYVVLTVSDNGCGMDAGTLAQIFEPFFTTKDLGKGTGLGLATVYGIVKQNHGFVYAYSEPGQGTTFKIYLPQVTATLTETIGASRAETPTGRGETILLVEDEKSLRLTCQRFLEALGYNVLSAGTPAEALSLLDQNPAGGIALVLTDVVMPGMNGRQLANRMLAVWPGVKVLFMSGYTADVIADRGVLEEHTAFIAKPFSRDDLGRKVREVLDTAAVADTTAITP